MDRVISDGCHGGLGEEKEGEILMNVYVLGGSFGGLSMLILAV